MLPIWSAAADPRVLVVRAEQASGASAHLFDAGDAEMRLLRGSTTEHALVLRHDTPVRLDVIAGSVTAGPVILHFDVVADDRLPFQLAAIQALANGFPRPRRKLSDGRRLLALHAVDAREQGASLREIAALVLGPGDWPGDGEHRKSLVRRLLAAGDRMIRAGPRAILGHHATATREEDG